MNRKLAMSGLLATLAASLFLAFFVVSSSGSSGAILVSNRGVAVTPPGGYIFVGKRSARATRLLGQRGGYAFYEVDTDRGTCVAFGSVGKRPAAACPTVAPFPSASRPALTYASVHAFRDHRAELIALIGFARDGVTSATFVTADGVTTTAPVSGNIFSLNVAGQLLNGGKLILADASGQTAYSQTY
jgi:hypothetical protein